MLISIGSVRKAPARSGPRRGRRRRRPGRAAGLLGVALALGVAVPACTSAPPSGSTATAGGSQALSAAGTSCAWPAEIGAQAESPVIYGAASAVWIQPIVAAAGTRIVLSGRFPDARYASFSIYTPGGGVTSLPDYRIAPQPGSVNPWQRAAAAGGRFTITIGPDPAPGQASTLPLPAGTTSQRPGYLFYRVYLPAGGSFAQVPLPVLTLEQGGATRTLPGCRSHVALASVFKGLSAAPARDPSGSGAATSPVPQLEFYALAQSETNAGLGDGDTGYAWAWLIRPPAADVVVVTAQAPTFAPGSHPSPWPAPGQDVRYWSMCTSAGTRGSPTVANKLPGGGTDYGCRADQATTLNAAGDYTYVIGSESQRAAISRVPGVTFLPFATSQASPVYLLVLRNMLVSGAFTHSPQAIKKSDDPAAAAAVMGAYYPRAAVCPLATLTARGPQACER